MEVFEVLEVSGLVSAKGVGGDSCRGPAVAAAAAVAAVAAGGRGSVSAALLR